MQTLDDKFVALDSYGVPISLNYRGRDNYKTRFGALMSIIMLIMLLVFAVNNGRQLITRSNP